MLNQPWIKYWIKDPFFGGINIVVHYTLRLLPIDTVSNIGGLLGELSGKFRFKKAQQRTENNLKQLYPGRKELELVNIPREMWNQVGRTVAEFSILEKINRDRISYHNFEKVKQQLKQDQAAIILFPHLGNWEVLVNYPKRLGYEVYSVREVLHNRFNYFLAEQTRRRVACRPITPDRQGVKLMFDILKNKGSIAIAMDEYKDKKVLSPAFGRSLSLKSNIALAVKMAIKFEAILLPVYCLRTDGAKFDAYCCDPIEVHNSSEGKDVLEDTVKKINDLCEKWIKQNPEQWYMLHRMKLDSFN